MLSTFPYYGGRFYQLREILGILEKHKDKFDVIVDVSEDPGRYSSIFRRNGGK